ncbi:hypothetical protein MPSEU_000458100 [Mayamaea pseudoterrestris]|nr:hypothetical protein MPSEU_000458100 [Mayamaea pseudoterrestris]
MGADKSNAKSSKKNMPSFLDDCDRPACDDMMSMLKAASNRVHKNANDKNINVDLSSDVESQQSAIRCPPKSAELGRSSWTLLHSMAAWYPDQPSETEQTLVRHFFAAIARFYPCTYCAEDFAENLKKSPVPAESRKGLCVWLCEQHNLVNEKLGKPFFSCDIKNLDERWRKSSRDDCQ